MTNQMLGALQALLCKLYLLLVSILLEIEKLQWLQGIYTTWLLLMLRATMFRTVLLNL